MTEKPEYDEATGAHTTGHTWDGDLKELNKPLPKWWLYVMYATIIWSIGYWVLYPAWPMIGDHTRGLLGYSQRETVRAEIEQARAAQGELADRVSAADLADIRADPDLLRFAIAGGRAAFGDNCASCHGRGAQGAVGYPNLNDDSWIWGGTLEAIEQTIRFGIRSDHVETRYSEMPRFGLDGILSDTEITDAAAHVRALAGLDHDADAAVRGAEIYAQQCAFCHGDAGEGMQELGAPRLSDNIWLYGSDIDSLITSIRTGRGGIMPQFANRLDDATIKKLAVYVHTLGGGE